MDRIKLRSQKQGSSPAVPDEGVIISSFSASSFPVGSHVGLGYCFNPSFGFRIEAEYLYGVGLSKILFVIEAKNQNASLDSDAKIFVSLQTILSNFYLDYYVIPPVNLYLSTGGGVEWALWASSLVPRLKFLRLLLLIKLVFRVCDHPKSWI